ncbi:MAG: glycoside hydrolase family 95-like protein, partial [Verrucomicrobiota bacterium]
VKDMQVSQRIKTWEPNPPVRIEQEGSLNCSVQDLKGGGQHAVAWQTSGNQLLASVCKSFPAGHVWHQPVAGAAAAQAKDWIRRERSDEWEQSHIDWWAEYYPKSFVSLPSEQVETLYWTQIYKMGSITRAHYPMTDTAGIWQTPSAWPYITWNLNVQLIYYPYYVSNRFELAESLINSLWNCRENLRKNIRPVEWQRDAYWVGLATGSDLDNPRHMDQRSFHKNAGGNLVWALHCVWLHWRHSMDAGLRDKFHELLRGAVTYMLYLTEKRDDGLFHLAETMSPEFGDTKDATYDVALLRWGLKTLIGLTDEAGAELDRWKDVLENLVPYHQDELGFMIGEGVSFDRSHRHFSHLMQIWPLYEVTVAQPENRELIEKSIDHFYKINQAEYDRTGHWDGFAAYTWTALSLLSAATGKGKDALRYLKGFMDYDLVRPNSLYGEMGPCQESPLSAVSCVHEMLLQSWGGIIRPFPAMPPEWKEAVFHQFSAEGGFEVSAEWKDSRLQWVLVHSRAGEPCRVAAENLSDMELKIDGQIQEFSIRSDESVHLALDSGASALFCRPGVCMAVRMLESDPVKQHCYGLNENRDQMKDSNEVKVYENAV